MKSLEERKAFRAKQVADREEANKPVKKTAAAAFAFNAVTYLNGTPETISKGLQGLNEADFAKLEPAEKAGKKRAAVLDALIVEKNRRAAGTVWDNNAG